MAQRRGRSASFEIRHYKPEEFSALHALDQQCFSPEIAYSQDDLRLFLAAKDSVTLVAEQAGVVVGFALLQIYRARPTFQARLITIDVSPTVRRQGLGGTLLRACEAELKLRMVSNCRLEVAESNAAAQALYKAHGYEYVTTLAQYYPTGEDALVMQKRL